MKSLFRCVSDVAFAKVALPIFNFRREKLQVRALRVLLNEFFRDAEMASLNASMGIPK